MSHADDMMTSVRGDIPKSIPYAPRFDIWFNAHQYRGTLPEIYADCSNPLDVSRRIGVAGHMVVPDYVRPAEPEDMYDRGIGIYHLAQVPYRVVMKGIDRTVSEHDGTTDVCYRTPKGTVTVSYSFTEDMRRSGSTISWVNRHAIQSPDDYRPLSYIFDHLDVEPSYSGLESMIRKTGGDALIVANGSMPASPMQYIMRDLMGMTEFFMAMADEPGRLGKLADAIGGYFERLMPVAADCPAEVILFGANTDATITYPPFYEEHILPWLSRFTGMAHDRGKYVAIHADGENKGLFELYRQSGIDILEAVAPLANDHEQYPRDIVAQRRHDCLGWHPKRDTHARLAGRRLSGIYGGCDRCRQRPVAVYPGGIGHHTARCGFRAVADDSGYVP